MATKLASLLVVAGFITGATAVIKWSSLRVKYSTSLFDGYFRIPLTIADSVGEYVKVGRDDQLNVDLYSYPNDPRLIVLYDSHGTVAGLRISYIKADLAKKTKPKNLPFPYSFFNKTMYTRAQYWGMDLWYTTVLFLSPEILEEGGRKGTGGLVAEDVYLKLYGFWTKISRDECQVEKQGFTKQGCYNGLGSHYYYNLTPDTGCEDLQLIALLFDKGQLVGLSFDAIGAYSALERNWFADFDANHLPTIIPNGPSCLHDDWIPKYSASSFQNFLGTS